MADKRLDVYYHGESVGTLAEMPDKRIAFQYSSKWQKEGFSINPLSLKLSNEVFIPGDNSRNIFHGLHGIFADSLPDAWGDLLMRNYLASVGIDFSKISVIDRLAYIGTSGIGALEYYPSKMSDFNINNKGMDFDSIASECNKILSSKKSDQVDLLYKLAGSSGGTRPKIFLIEDNKEWIIKFPAKTDPLVSGKREYDYAQCAVNCGINMMKTELVPSKVCDGYFKTLRFDRKNSTKLFTATFAGLLNVDYNAPSCDYSTFMKLIQVLTKDNTADKQQMYKQMCFNVLAHNLDDHTKNFSFTFTEDKGWHLSPAYDITYSDTYFGEHTTSVNGKGVDILDEDIYKVGTDAGLPTEYVINTLQEIKEKIKELDVYINSSNSSRHRKTPLKSRIEEIKN